MQTPAGSGVPAASGVHAPWLPATAHELQLPQLADAQQYPSVQWVLMHTVPDVQAAPFGLRLVQDPD